MAHVVLAAPSIARYHLHDAFARRLRDRGHRVTAWVFDPAAAAFFATQGLPAVLVRAGEACDHPRVPLEELAVRECRRLGDARPGLDALRRARDPLDRTVEPLLRLFDATAPDLVWLHRRRDARSRLLHFLAREFGSHVVHSGDGLWPGTMQWDTDGLDGDATACARRASDYRDVRPDDELVGAALTAMLGGALPPGVPPRAVRVPPWAARVRACAAAALAGRPRAAADALVGWRRALPARPVEPSALTVPVEPFAAVLLQRGDDERLRLDAVEPPDHARLLLRVRGALEQAVPGMPVLVVTPRGGLPANVRRRVAALPGPTSWCAWHHAHEAAALAAAVVTVNHPGALAGVLIGTPVLHLGKASWALPGVATATGLDTLAADLRRAFAQPSNEALRTRFATRCLRDDHVWCDVAAPDANGLQGLAAVAESLAGAAAGEARLRYRAGPAWPLGPARARA